MDSNKVGHERGQQHFCETVEIRSPLDAEKITVIELF
jgi:hypothetical protein